MSENLTAKHMHTPMYACTYIGCILCVEIFYPRKIVTFQRTYTSLPMQLRLLFAILLIHYYKARTKLIIINNQQPHQCFICKFITVCTCPQVFPVDCVH